MGPKTAHSPDAALVVGVDGQPGDLARCALGSKDLNRHETERLRRLLIGVDDFYKRAVGFAAFFQQPPRKYAELRVLPREFSAGYFAASFHNPQNAVYGKRRARFEG